MKLVCLAKLVPDPRATIRVLGDGSAIDRTGLKYVCDPFDEFGIELALQLRDRSLPGTVTAVTAGPAAAAEALRHALAMGCDRAVHVLDDQTPAADEPALARRLAEAIRAVEAGVDLVVCGKQNIDNDAGELGPALAECLDLPHVGAVTRLDLAADGRRFQAHRRVEGAEEVVDVSLPALVTAEKGLVEPRRPALARLMKAKQHPIETRTSAASITAPGARVVRFLPPPARPACVMIHGEPAAMAQELVRRLREEAKVL